MPRPLAHTSVAFAALLLLTGAAEAAGKKKKKAPAAGAPASEGAIAAEPTKLACQAPDEAAAQTELVIECESERWLEDARVELHYRAAGQESYTAVAMPFDRKGPLRGKVPAEQVKPPFLQYYVQATMAPAGVVAANGRHDSPTIVRVQPPAPPPDLGRLGPGADGTVDASASGGPGLRATGAPRAPGSYWVGLSLGSGYGWQARSRLEYRSDLEAASGFGPAGLGHLAPEVGYQITPQIAVALSGRHQFISGGGGEPAFPGRPARWAHAVLARGMYVVDRGPFGLFGAAQIGGGDGFRFRFAPDPVSGRPRHDTTRGGPLVLGPGAGMIYRLRARYSLVVETSLLFGAPEFAAMADLNLGVQVNL